jgi:hypothetical protein
MSLSKMTVRSKIYCLVAVCTIAVISYGIWSYNTLTIAKVHGPHYNRIV